MQLTFDMLFELDDTNKEVMEFVIQKSTLKDLKELLRSKKIKGFSKFNKKQIVNLVIQTIKGMAKEKIDSLISNVKLLTLDIPEEMKPLKQKLKMGKSYSCDGLYFTGIWNKKLLKYRYRVLCKKLHPDTSKEDSIDFLEMKKEYDIRMRVSGKTSREITKNMSSEEKTEWNINWMHNVTLNIDWRKNNK